MLADMMSVTSMISPILGGEECCNPDAAQALRLYANMLVRLDIYVTSWQSAVDKCPQGAGWGSHMMYHLLHIICNGCYFICIEHLSDAAQTVLTSYAAC